MAAMFGLGMSIGLICHELQFATCAAVVACFWMLCDISEQIRESTEKKD
jgi:hypothetical protein